MRRCCGIRLKNGSLLDTLLPCCAASQRSALLAAVLLLFVVGTSVLWYGMRYPYKLNTALQTSHEQDMDKLLGKLDKNVSVNIYDITQPYDTANFKCVKTRTRPSVTVCLYSPWHDQFISRSLQTDSIWEPYIVKEFIEAVERSDSSAGVLDIGANIGYYTLLAARLGHRVLAVEPLLDSIQRLHRAAQIDNTADKIVVVNNALAEIRTTATLRPSGDNQGDAKIELQVKECRGACPATIDTILLDDLADLLPFRQAVMKMDIQGYEHHAFQRAGKLFRKIHFTHIFMEWETVRDHYVSANHTSQDKVLVEHMIRFLFRRGIRPYALVSEGGRPLDPVNWHLWPLNVVWRHTISSAEESTLSRNHFRNWPS